MKDTAWVREVLDSVDGMDTEAFLRFLADDARFRFGSAPTVAGKDAIRQAVDGFFGTIKALRHEILEVWSQGQTVICQGDVTYTRTDDSAITLPFVTLWRLQGDYIGEYLIYIDSAPLFAPAC